MRVSKEAFCRLIAKAHNRNVPYNEVCLMCDIAHRQIVRGKWPYGNPIEIFKKDGYPCIRYAEGIWFHYDLVKGTWF